MADGVVPEYVQFVAREREAGRLAAPRPAMREGEVFDAVFVERARLAEFARVAARRSAGLVRPSARHEIVWVDGANQLAVDLAKLDVRLDEGQIHVRVPVRCDEVGSAEVVVLFVVGSDKEPAGLYAATSKRPVGPELVVDLWGDALVAFAWQCVLGMVSGIAAATGKDGRGNLLVPVEIVAGPRGIGIVPMARHRFAGSSGLKPAAVARR
ncbi:hypothetical protein [Piscinibacter koreensis]|uniref:Uncharacterized protein n=1 Tax=Piscinibacter koreensis TaxID=2742824 RepID=A0A7Y6TYM1_9BURK|nr:hypothetical protein [Schlegelella koreensis]NUZ08359.1 hypothetical protein [Schlegelella koreensis]